MAKAFVPKIDEVVSNGDGTFTLNMTVIFNGTDVPGGTDASLASATIDGSESPVQMKNKVSSSVIAEANRIGYSLVGNDIVIPSYVKG